MGFVLRSLTLMLLLQQENPQFFGSVGSQNQGFFDIRRAARSGDGRDHGGQARLGIAILDELPTVLPSRHQLAWAGDDPMNRRQNGHSSSHVLP